MLKLRLIVLFNLTKQARWRGILTIVLFVTGLAGMTPSAWAEEPDQSGAGPGHSSQASDSAPSAILREAQARLLAQIDLRSSDWQVGKLLDLDGTWSFYWHRLLTPADFHQPAPELWSAAEPFAIPGLWNRPKSAATPHPQAHDAAGYGTFAVEVLLPAAMQPAYLRIPDMPSAYKLWANGVLVAQNGEPGKDKASEKPGFLPKLVRLEPAQGRLELVLQVSNFHHKEGGVWHSFEVTDSQGRHWLYEIPLISAVTLFAILLTIGLYHLSVFSMRRQEKASLYFGLFCLVVGFRSVLVGQRIFYMLDWGSWDFLYRLEHLLFYLGAPFFCRFCYELFPADIHRSVCRWTLWVALVFCGATWVLPAEYFTRLSPPYQLVIIAVCLYLMACYVRIVRQRRPGYLLFGLSFLVLLVVIVNDILYAHMWARTVPLVHVGLVGFVITQAIMLNRRYVHSLELVEEMSQALQQRNLALERMNQFKDEFLATTSHELRTPLQGIAGLTELLLENPSRNLQSAQREQLNLIAASAKRLGGLVNDILDYAAIKHGSLQLHARRVDLRAVVGLVLSSINPLVRGKSIQLAIAIDDNARFVIADENRLQQILFNLVGNSVKFTEQGSIRISARLRYDRVAICVADTGIGIAAEKMHALFRPFEPIDTDLGSSWGSSGLGLTICRQLVEHQGGVLGIESSEGVGTQVSFDLPVAAAADASSAATLPESAEEWVGQNETIDPVELAQTGPESATEDWELLTDVRRQHEVEQDEISGMDGISPLAGDSAPVISLHALVYVVDDDEVNRQLLRQQLQRVGCRVECFASGGSLLERLPQQVPDLILLDLMMPRLNGFQVCERIRQQYNSYELPILMLTARHQVGDIVHALSLGANDYLFKPHHQRELAARVASLIGQRRFWLASLENRQLRDEIERRRQAESSLESANQRLHRLLDCSNELVMLADQDGNLLYVNRATEMQFARSRHNLLGESLDNLLLDWRSDRMQGLATSRQVTEMRLRESHQVMSGLTEDEGDNSRDNLWQLRVLAVEFQDESLWALIFARAPALASTRAEATEESRRRLAALSDAVNSLAPRISDEECLAESGSEVASEQSQRTRQKLVALLRCSLNLWERYTGKTKIELAEESRCWRVYVDGGTVKTRTLDKYLSLKSLPANPRWRLVVRTAHFVRNQCGLKEADLQQLDELLQQLETLYA